MPKRPTKKSKRSKRVVDSIHGRLKATHGAIAQALEKLEWDRSMLSNFKSRGDMKVSQLYELSKILGEHPSRTLEIADGIGVRLSPYGDAPTLVDQISCASGGGLKKPVLVAIDDMNQLLPDQALKFLAESISLVGREERVSSLALLGSIYLRRLKFNDALHSFSRALALAQGATDRGNVLMRRHVLEHHLGLTDLAIKTLNEALLDFSERRNYSMIGEVLVARASMFYYQGDPEEATERYMQASAYADELSKEALIALFQGMAACHIATQAELLSEKYVRLAWSHGQTLGDGEVKAKAAWLFSGFTEERRLDLLEWAFQVLSSASPIDGALIACDLLELYVEEGLFDKVRSVSFAMMEVVEKLDFIPAAKKAASELVQYCVSGRREAISPLQIRENIDEGWASAKLALRDRLIHLER